MERKKMRSLPSFYLNKPEMRDIQSIIAPFIFIRSGLTAAEEALMDERLTEYCDAFNRLKMFRPSTLPIRHITSYLSKSNVFKYDLLETAEALMTYTNSSDMELYFVDDIRSEIYRCPRVPNENDQITRLKIGPGSTVAAYVAFSKTAVFADDLINDDNYPMGLNKKDSVAQRVICIPITTPSNELAAVMEWTRDIHMKPYTAKDFEACMNTCTWIGTALDRSHKLIRFKRKLMLYDYFNRLVNVYFVEHIPFKQYMSELLSYTAKVLNAQNSIFYMASETGRFQLTTNNINYDMYVGSDDFRHQKKLSFSNATKTIASEVHRTKATLNLDKEDIINQRYDLEIYKPLVINSSLAMPALGYAMDRAVAEVINKEDKASFRKQDVDLFSKIVVYAGFALSTHKMNEEIKKLKAFLTNITRTLILKFEPSKSDMSRFMKMEIEKPPDLYEISFVPSRDRHVFLCKLIDMMFFDVVERWKLIPEEKRARFLLIVHKASVFWEGQHFGKVFCTVQCLTTIIKLCENVFTPLEIELMMYSALCHAVNAPQVKERNLLSDLDAFPDISKTDYSTSYYYTKLIFKDCGMFTDESETDILLKKINKLMEACYHVRFIGKDEKIILLLSKGAFNLENKKHRHLLRTCVMAISGFGIHFKPFMFTLEHVIKKKFQEIHISVKNTEDIANKVQFLDRRELAVSEKTLLDTFVIPWTLTLRTILPQITSLIIKLLEERENWCEVTKEDITKEAWIPLKVNPTKEKQEILLFLENVSKDEKNSNHPLSNDVSEGGLSHKRGINLLKMMSPHYNKNIQAQHDGQVRAYGN